MASTEFSRRALPTACSSLCSNASLIASAASLMAVISRGTAEFAAEWARVFVADKFGMATTHWDKVCKSVCVVGLEIPAARSLGYPLAGS